MKGVYHSETTTDPLEYKKRCDQLDLELNLENSQLSASDVNCDGLSRLLRDMAALEDAEKCWRLESDQKIELAQEVRNMPLNLISKLTVRVCVLCSLML